jgi:hypothetical protein
VNVTCAGVRLAAACVCVLLAASCSAPDVAGPAEDAIPGVRPPAGQPANKPVLAEALCESPRIRVQVTEVVRTGPESVLVKFRLLNPDKVSAVDVGDAFADAPGGTGSLSGVSVVDETGRKRLFVLRDDQGRPQCSTGLGPIAPGGQVEAWARFPASAGQVMRLAVQVPRLAAFRDLAVADMPAGTGPTGPSY